MNNLFLNKFVYHIYALGLSGAPKRNDFACPAGNFFETLTGELDRLCDLGVNAILIGPVFESTSHGYDTVDYYHIDRRLGNNEKFAAFCKECHNRNISVLLDAVLNHTGRDFFAFKDLIQNGQNSQYKDWYLNINFEGRSCYGDNFDYDGWAGCKDLVKLNGENPEVQQHLYSAVEFWIKEFGIDGLRLDAADVLSKNFMDGLSAYTKKINPDFYLMGEVVHGDYNDWAREGRLDSVTNYQIYKSMWSAINEKNMYELSYNLNREFGMEEGMYKNLPLFNFVDNHDVNRIASTVKSQDELPLLYGLLFTIPGTPSVYYGSEFGIKGARGEYDDYQLRPCLPPFSDAMPDFATPEYDSNRLQEFIKSMVKLRNESIALQKGSYKQLFISNEVFAFERKYENECCVVCLSCSSKSEKVNITGLEEFTIQPMEIKILKR